MASQKNRKSATTSTLSVLEYAGHRVLEIRFRGKRCWVLAHVECALGYAAGGIADLIQGEWKRELVSGKHYDVVRGQDLKDLKASFRGLDAPGYHPVPSKASQITVLYQEGLDLVILKTHKPQGIELRALLVDHVIPQLRETGSATLPGAPIDMESLAKAVAAQLSPQLTEIQSSFTAQALLNPKFRMATIQSKIQQCVNVALCISPNPRSGRSKRPSKNPTKAYTTSFYNLIRSLSDFGVTGCRWDGAPLDTFMKAVGALDGMLAMLKRLNGGVLPVDARQMPMFKGSN